MLIFIVTPIYTPSLSLLLLPPRVLVVNTSMTSGLAEVFTTQVNIQFSVLSDVRTTVMMSVIADVNQSGLYSILIDETTDRLCGKNS